MDMMTKAAFKFCNTEPPTTYLGIHTWLAIKRNNSSMFIKFHIVQLNIGSVRGKFIADIYIQIRPACRANYIPALYGVRSTQKFPQEFARQILGVTSQ